jgi:G3E family GTPase
MLANIPTHLIAGPLGAGKTSLIRHLLAHKPAAERWAVLINEFGQIGLDQALLTSDQDGVSLAEIPGGCLCCVGGAPFQVGLGRLLRQARPDRLLIEPSGLGHPAELLRQLGEAPWRGVLAAGQPLPESQREALELAGLLLLNKAEAVDASMRARLQAQLPARTLRWTSQGVLDFAELPGSAAQAGPASEGLAVPQGRAPLAQVWSDPRQPICQVQEQADGWSIGWRFHPSQVFELMRVQTWLAGLPWRRAKLVLHSNAGWLSANALDGEAPHWQASEWRRDSRLELIFAAPQDGAALAAALAECRR